MGDPKLKTLSMARRELEELYLGVPDESVNLTFEDLAVATARHQPRAIITPSSENKRHAVDPNSEENKLKKLDKLSSLNKLPSLDFSQAMQASKPNHYHHHHRHQHSSHVGHADSVDSPTMNYHRRHHHIEENNENDLHPFSDDGHHRHQGNLNGTKGDNHHSHHRYMNGSNGDNHHHNHHYMNGSNGDDQNHHHHQVSTPTRVGYSSSSGFRHGVESMTNFDDVSGISMAVESMTNFDDVSGISMASNVMNHRERGGRRRPGIPHSNICTRCTTYIYIFRHRCLVCGRVYCRNCVSIGMGEMTEGRKCVECLGKRFSQRYIQRAGKVGCWSRYPAKVKQAELKWADKGPRGSGERGYEANVMMSRSRSPIPAKKGNRSISYNSNNPPSFVMNSNYAPYSPTRHHLPF